MAAAANASRDGVLQLREPQRAAGLKKVENAARRRVVFFKRRNGLLKKAFELSKLCDAEVALLIFSESGKLYEFSNRGVQETLKRYSKERCTVPDNPESSRSCNIEKVPASKVKKILKQIGFLRRKHRNMMGEELDVLSRKQLDGLEKQLQVALSRVYHRRMILLAQMYELLSKEVAEADRENRNLKAEVNGEGDAQVELFSATNDNERQVTSLAMPLIDSFMSPSGSQRAEPEDSQIHAQSGDTEADLHLRLI